MEPYSFVFFSAFETFYSQNVELLQALQLLPDAILCDTRHFCAACECVDLKEYFLRVVFVKVSGGGRGVNQGFKCQAAPL